MKNILDLFAKEPALARGLGLLLVGIAGSLGLVLTENEGYGLVMAIMSLLGLAAQISTRGVVRPVAPDKDKEKEMPRPVNHINSVPLKSKRPSRVRNILSDESSEAMVFKNPRPGRNVNEDATEGEKDDTEELPVLDPKVNEAVDAFFAPDGTKHSVRGEAIDAWGNKGM